MTDNTLRPTETKAVAELAMAADSPDTWNIDGAMVLTGAYPAGWQLIEHDLERYEPRPRRRKGVVRLTDTASLLTYIERQQAPDDELPPVYLAPDEFRAVAIFDDHAGGLAGWREHRAQLQLRATDEWQAWAKIDKAYMSATEFAEFVEEWRHTIADPPTADILDMVRSFRATTKVSFRDEIVERNGDRALEYVTETTANAGASGKLEIPAGFGLVLAPFEGADLRPLAARFRYRVGDGRALFGVVLEQPKLVAKAAFDAEVAKLHAAGLTTMVGSPA